MWVIHACNGLTSLSQAKRLIRLETFDHIPDSNGPPTITHLILKCDYDGGFWAKTIQCFPSKKEAEKNLAPKIIPLIKNKRQKLLAELGKWAKLQAQYENLLPKPTVRLGETKLPKTWGLVNGEKF